MLGRPHDPGRRRLALLGVIIACSVAAGIIQASRFPPGDLRYRPVAGALAAATVLPLAWRDRRPLAAFGACACLGGALSVATAGAPAAAPLTTLAALYAVTTRRSRFLSLGCCVLTVAGTGLWIALTRPDRLFWQAFALPVVAVAVVWLAADRARVRRAYLAELHARAARTEADRQADTERATAAERARIARELHDVVAHHVSMIAVQAGAARMLRDQHTPGQSPHDVLDTIEAAARQALSELRRLLGVLHSPADDNEPDLAPPPGLHLLRDLVEQVRAAGLPARLSIDGTPPSLSPGTSLSAYRIVQEALTNVARHQGSVPVAITVDYTAGDVRLEITSEASPARAVSRPARGAGAGRGLIGMRERAAMLGGELHATPLPDGRYRVQARLPAGEPA